MLVTGGDFVQFRSFMNSLLCGETTIGDDDSHEMLGFGQSSGYDHLAKMRADVTATLDEFKRSQPLMLAQVSTE